MRRGPAPDIYKNIYPVEFGNGEKNISPVT